MSDNNLYSTPKTEVQAHIAVHDNLKDLDFKQLKNLHNHSSTINAITFLVVLSLILVTTLPMFLDIEFEAYMKFVFIGLALLYAVSAVGLLKRTAWGRILGIIVCLIYLIKFPIGTAIGAFGLFAFFGAPRLFGANRITHKELKAEFQLQKANMKKDKKNARSKAE